MRGPAARILLASEVRHPRAAQAARVLREAARDALAALGLRGCELSVALVSDRTIRRLNRSWRGKDRPTDVLSFPQGGTKASPGPIGDVVISLHTALRQAEEGGWGLSRELRRLLAHGLLHCLGHDHETPAGARRMARAEQRLLGREGMVGAALSDAQAPRRNRAAPRKRP
jgi:probable rRNA maturation factor